MSYYGEWNNPSPSWGTSAPTLAPTWAPVTSPPTWAPVASPAALGLAANQALDCSFRGVQQLPFDMTLQQITNPEEGTVTIELTTPKQAWLALGFGSQMVGTTAVVGLPDEGTVSKMFLGSQRQSDFVNVDSSSLSDASIAQTPEGGTVLRFTKPLVEEGETAVASEGNQNIIVAAGRSNTFGFHEDYSPLLVEMDACLDPTALTGNGNADDNGDDPPPDFNADDLDCTLRSGLEITSGVSIKEVYNQVEQTATIEMTYENEEGAWLGIALASSGFMVGNTAVIGLPDEPVEPGVNPAKYFLGGKVDSAVTRVPDAEQTLTDASIVQNATHTVMTFTQPLVQDGEREVLVGNGVSNSAIFATGRGNSFADGIHSNFGAFDLTLTACLEPGETPPADGGNKQADLFNDEAPNKGLWRLHGLLMGIGWGLLVPLAVGAALTRKLMSNHAGLWFKLHRGLNTIALGCCRCHCTRIRYWRTY